MAAREQSDLYIVGVSDIKLIFFAKGGLQNKTIKYLIQCMNVPVLNGVRIEVRLNLCNILKENKSKNAKKMGFKWFCEERRSIKKRKLLCDPFQHNQFSLSL